MTGTSQSIAYLTVSHDGEESLLVVPVGAVLREVLLANGISPYTWYTERYNCGGRGLCVTCGVRFAASEPIPEHWHDRLAARFGYPRLSCQITVEEDMTVRIPEKAV